MKLAMSNHINEPISQITAQQSIQMNKKNEQQGNRYSKMRKTANDNLHDSHTLQKIIK